MAMVPPAPGRSSTMTFWPSSRDSPSASTRARMSVVLPAASGQIRVIGRVG
jgi:hypothetical protein